MAPAYCISKDPLLGSIAFGRVTLCQGEHVVTRQSGFRSSVRIHSPQMQLKGSIHFR